MDLTFAARTGGKLGANAKSTPLGADELNFQISKIATFGL
jgi:hypothetical protein